MVVVVLLGQWARRSMLSLKLALLVGWVLGKLVGQAAASPGWANDKIYAESQARDFLRYFGDVEGYLQLEAALRENN